MEITPEQYIQGCVSIDPLRIQEEYVRLSSDLYYWRGKYADSLDEEAKSENLRKDAEASVYLELRHEKDVGKKLGTEEQIKLRVRLDSRVHNARERERQAMVEKSRVWGIIEAINAKKDLLVSLGATIRQEKDLTLRENR